MAAALVATYPAELVNPIDAATDEGVFVHLSGTEWKPGSSVTIYAQGKWAAELVTDTQGSFAGQIPIPRDLNAAAAMEIAAKDEAGNSDSLTLSYTP